MFDHEQVSPNNVDFDTGAGSSVPEAALFPDHPPLATQPFAASGVVDHVTFGVTVPFAAVVASTESVICPAT